MRLAINNRYLSELYGDATDEDRNDIRTGVMLSMRLVDFNNSSGENASQRKYSVRCVSGFTSFDCQYPKEINDYMRLLITDEEIETLFPTKVCEIVLVIMKFNYSANIDPYFFFKRVKVAPLVEADGVTYRSITILKRKSLDESPTVSESFLLPISLSEMFDVQKDCIIHYPNLVATMHSDDHGEGNIDKLVYTTTIGDVDLPIIHCPTYCDAPEGLYITPKNKDELENMMNHVKSFRIMFADGTTRVFDRWRICEMWAEIMSITEKDCRKHAYNSLLWAIAKEDE